MSDWTINSAELRRRRVAKMLDQAQLARAAALSARTIRLLEASDRGVNASTVEGLAGALACKATDIAAHRASPRRGKSLPPRATGERVRMSELVAIGEREPEETLVIAGEAIAKLTPLQYQHCYTAFLARDGERYWLEGAITDERGLPPQEAALLDAKSGEAARFEVTCPVGRSGHTLVVTAHTTTGALTVAMQKARKLRSTRALVRLAALRDLAPGAGLTCFVRERPSPWTLVVERMIAAPERAASKTKARARRTTAGRRAS